MQACLLYILHIEIIHDIKGRKNIIVYAKTWFPWRRKFLIKLIKKETPKQVFFCKFCEIFKKTFFMKHLQSRLLFFLKNYRFLFLFSDENNIAKLAFDICGNCSNRLWYRLETCNSFLKSLQNRCFPMNFAKFLRNSFLQNTSGQLLLDLFIHFTVLPPGELIETSLFPWPFLYKRAWNFTKKGTLPPVFPFLVIIWKWMTFDSLRPLLLTYLNFSPEQCLSAVIIY